ncbi:MAG: pyruvate:ferredoxin (flavodoxin) oxidoreductase [Bacteroidales bacterium]|jgi:pyruvate-ferredoxin/flavodoxin oxidoreductase|nr:pyruvate:ferredoxin (flavodoxin) oxidoreductase [Bacteroidales bacterium]
MTDKRKFITCDGNFAAAHVSYAFTETAGIYPITPSSDMAEHADTFAANGRKNIFGDTVKVVEMQSEAGAAGTVHGSLQAGALTTTYTASQGLLLMLPNMYKISGELLPGVFHVSARSIAAQALSIFGDHQDVYAARMTGFSMLSSGSVQEVMDLGAVAHLASIKSSLPTLHFFDGFRTSHEIQKIQAWDYDELAEMVDYDAIQKFREKALNPEHPVTRGTAQNPDVYFQSREAANTYYNAVPKIIEDYMQEVNKRTGRNYQLFNYFGADDAEHVVIAMGSVSETIRETIEYMNKQGKKVGFLQIHLYRPFSIEHFLQALPKSVTKIAVLDRTKEPGSTGEPLYLDICNAFYGKENAPIIVGGRYGLSSKDTTPRQIVSVFTNLEQPEPKNGFTMGIVDDVTFTSLLESNEIIDTVPEGTVECKFYGLGSDGTVGANKNSIKIIGDNTDMYAQGYFAYDSKKSGGITISHLRFGKKPITSTYLVSNPSFVSCSEPSYLDKYDMLKGIQKGGTFLLNSLWDASDIEKYLPNKIKKQLAENNVKFFIINATKVAEGIGLGNRTNTILQSAFFKLASVIPYDQAVDFMKTAIKKTYGTKGDEIVKMNWQAVDKGVESLQEVTVKPEWKDLVDNNDFQIYQGITDKTDKELADFVTNVAGVMNQQEGDSLPVSAFAKYPDGTFPNGTTAFEKRGVAVNVPEWQPDNCIQCNQCAYVCPHAVIRPFLFDEEELANAPEGLQTLKPIGKGFDGLQYKIQISPLDCTGCGSCANICPGKKGEQALIMKPIQSQLPEEKDNWNYILENVTYKDTIAPVSTVKGSQFKQPLFEFSGACAGCGETPYVKLITQLFGDRMTIANATGCSSIYGGSAPATPYIVNDEGKGVAWANSLFEDNAEFGYGMAIAMNKLRERIAEKLSNNMSSLSSDIQEAGKAWIEGKDNAEASIEAGEKLVSVLEKDSSQISKDILALKQYLTKKSNWILGGDGWAYDIGYGGLDHVLASGEDINVLVLDTEVYSNTGGQSSKASPTASVAKFASAGKKVRKKDLGRMAMTYGYVYVAQVSMGANQAQLLKAIREAEAYPGPSLVIAYSPCIAHGIKGGLTKSQTEEKTAVTCGYWHLFRYDPRLEEEGKNPFQLDSKEPDFNEFLNYLKNEVRYTSLSKTFPEVAEQLFEDSLKDAKWRYKQYKLLTEMNYSEE